MGATAVNTGHLWFDQAALVPSYDADGNLLSDGRWTYTWDAENRMTKMVTTTAATDAGHPYTKLEFKYDFLGRRTERAIWYKGTASSPTFKSRARWMYVGWNPVIEFSSNAGGTSLTRKLEFTWGSDLSGSMEGAGGVGGLLMQRTVSDGKLRRPAYDGNGNITAWALKGSGGTANPNMEQLRTEYDAFGNIVVSEGTLNSEFGFSTKIRDPYTGLCYYGYRYYDPVTGRWPSRDAIGERGGVNFYGFVGNDGVNWWDYLGWWKKGDEIKVKCGGMMSKVAGKIKVADYSVEKGQVTQTDGLRCQGALATLTLKFEESDPKCCCKNGKYQWFQTITEDNDPGKANKKVPRSDAGPPSLATLVGTDFDDNPGIPAKNVEALWKRDGGKHMKKGAKIEVKFKLEFQCKEDGKEARTLKTIKWGLWYSVDKCGVTKAGVE